MGRADDLANFMSLRSSGVKDIPPITPTKYLIYSQIIIKKKYTKIYKMSKSIGSSRPIKTSKDFNSKTKFIKN